MNLEFILAPIDKSEYNNKLNLLLSGDEQVDIFLTKGWEELQRKGVLADLTDELEKFPELTGVFGSAMEAMKTSGGQI